MKEYHAGQRAWALLPKVVWPRLSVVVFACDGRTDANSMMLQRGFVFYEFVGLRGENKSRTSSMDTSALSSEMTMGRRPIAKSGLFFLVSTEEVHLRGGVYFGVVEEPFSVRRCGL